MQWWRLPHLMEQRGCGTQRTVCLHLSSEGNGLPMTMFCVVPMAMLYWQLLFVCINIYFPSFKLTLLTVPWHDFMEDAFC